MDPLDLPAEALALAGGLLRDEPLTEEIAEEARGIPRKWAELVTAFLDEEDWRKFKMGPTPDYEDTHEDLVTGRTPDDNAIVIEQVRDSALGQAYLAKVSQVRQYLVERWPINQLEIGAGPPANLPPSTMQQGQAWALFAVLNGTTRILDEMLMGTLLADQAKAFKDNFPGLFDRLRGLLEAEVKERVARAPKKTPYSMPWARERVLRCLLGLPQEAKIVTKLEAPPAAPAPAGPGGEISIDFAKERPRFVESAA